MKELFYIGVIVAAVYLGRHPEAVGHWLAAVQMAEMNTVLGG